MMIQVRAHVGSKQNKIVVDEQRVYQVYVTARAIDGKANEAIIEALAEYLDTAKSNLKIVRGHLGREKLIEIAE
jgi:uncharacterized protein (TIGR00251 family)